MTSINAKSSNLQQSLKLVVFVVYPNFVLLDLSGPLQVFTHAQTQSRHQVAYETAIVSVEGGKVESNTIISIETAAIADLKDRAIHTLIVVGGDGAYDSMHDERLIENVTTLAAKAQRVCSVCTGALILAATGILDGHRAVTHWEDCDQLHKWITDNLRSDLRVDVLAEQVNMSSRNFSRLYSSQTNSFHCFSWCYFHL